MLLQLSLLHLVIFLHLPQPISSSSNPIAKNGCPDRCGNLTIPYPFGVGSGCCRSESFDITCNTSTHPPKPMLYINHLIEVLEITSSQIRIKYPYLLNKACYDESGNIDLFADYEGDWNQDDWSETQYTFSDENWLTAVGCDDLVLGTGKANKSFGGGCVAYCASARESGGTGFCVNNDNGYSPGNGCCRTPIPRVRFTQKRGAEEKAAAPESKKPRSAAGRAASTPDLRLTAPTPADSPTAIAGSSRQQEKVASAAVITGGDASLAGTPIHLEDLHFPEGVGMVMSRIREELRWFETGAEQLGARHEDELNRYSDQLAAAKAKLGKANTEVKALKADLAAERARAAEEAEEAGRLRAELKAAKGGLRAAKDGQGEVLRAYTKRLLLSDQFSELARDLAELINGNAALEVIEEVAKDYPGLDASKYGYQKLEGAAVYTQYAKVVRRHLDRLPLLNELVSSPALLTAEVVASCSTDRDAELDAAFDALSGEDVEMEEVGAGAEEERAEKEPSSSRGADSPKVADTGVVGEEAFAEKQPTPEKEVGEP